MNKFIHNLKSFLSDLLILAKLLVFAVYSSTLVATKNIFIPKRYLTKSIKGQVALITGAAGGIGKHLVVELLQQGCTVCCLDRCENSLKLLESYLDNISLNRHVYFYNTDVTKTEEIKEIAKQINTHIGSIDIIINNAGVFNKGKLFTELSEKEIEDIFNINILAQMYVCREFLPQMIAKNSGHIVNMCSSLGQFGAYRVTDYCATKFAVNGFTEALRIELKTMQSALTVTLVCPYHVNTNLFKGFEMEKFSWAKVSQNDPVAVAKSVVEGMRMGKELIGYPKVQFYLFLAIKNFMTTYATDNMMIWFGFNDAINKTVSNLKKSK